MKIKNQFRASSAPDVKYDAEKRTIIFPFSSEFPVERWFGTEILSHDEGAMDLSRLNDGGALLWNHKTDTVLGVIERAWKGTDKRIWAEARLSKNAKGEEVRQDIEDKILRNVSFGYQIKEMKLTKETKGQPPEYTATKWLPFEVSIVTIPADPTVGLGRSEGNEEIEVTVINESKRSLGETRENMDPEQIKQQQQQAEQARIEAEKRTFATDAVKAERERISAIEKLGAHFKKADLARQLVEGGKSIDEARAAILETLGREQKPVSESAGEVGLSVKEKQSYSFMRALQALMHPGDKRFQEAAAFEREASDAAATISGKAARGLIVPIDILRHSGRRDLTVGTSTAGGNLVSTDLIAGSFIELLRNKSVVQQAGATVLNGLVGNIAIPKQTGAASAYWVAESGSPTESAQTIGQVAMSPKTVGAFNDYSRKLMLQSSIDVESFIRADLAAVIALEIDRAALYGSGSANQPTGLKAVLAAYNSASQESNFAAGTPTFAEVIGLETKVTAANGDISAMKYILNASMRGALKAAVKVSGYPSFIMESDGSMNGYGGLVSNQVASGDVFFGVWSQLLMGFWSGLDLMVDPYTASTSGTVRVVALQDCDIACRHAESFARGNDTP